MSDEMKPIGPENQVEGGPKLPPGIPKVPSAEFPADGKIDADVIVIGGGGAGIPAALQALENGAKRVVMIEKRDRAGGNAIMARGIFGCESDVLRNAFVYTDKDEIYTNAMRWHHYDRVNGKLLRAYINQSGDTIDWIMKRGIEFRIDTTTRMSYLQDPTWHCVVGGNMAKAMGALFRDALDKGLEVYFETHVDAILKENGKVVGVRATHEGKELLVNAPAVIVTTGGFLPMEEKVKKYYPAYSTESFGGFMVKSNTGDGIELIENAGGALESYITLIREACAADDRAPRLLSEFVREPYHMWVNKKGSRFVEETAGANLQICTNALMMQPGVKAFALFDAATREYMEAHGFEMSKGDELRGKPIKDIDGKLRDIAKKAPDGVIVADTIEEVAAWIGCDPKALQEEVDNYNRYCNQGYDEDFNKQRRYLMPVVKAPFYCIMHQGIAVDTIGPVRINHKTEVIDENYDSIPGLYAAGVITSGWQSNDYCGQYLFGSALSYSINSGRIAGKNAWVYVKTHK